MQAIVGTKHALKAFEEGREYIDLVVGSGSATNCVRVGWRDQKYLDRHGVVVVAPRWAEVLTNFIRTDILATSLDRIAMLQQLLRLLASSRSQPSKDPLVHVTAKGHELLEGFDASVLDTLACAAPGLMTTLAIRRVLAPELAGIVDNHKIEGQFYAAHCDRKATRFRSFSSRLFGRTCGAVRTMPTLDTLLRDTRALRKINDKLVRICEETMETWSK